MSAKVEFFNKPLSSSSTTKVVTTTSTVVKKRNTPTPLYRPTPSNASAKRKTSSSRGPSRTSSPAPSSTGSTTSSYKRSKTKNGNYVQVFMPEDESEDDNNNGTSASALSRVSTPVIPQIVERYVAADEDIVLETRVEGFVHSNDIVQPLLGGYEPYFKQPRYRIQEDGSYPTIELEYPAIGAPRETFALLSPKKYGEYDPISEVLRIIRTVIDCYLTPDQQEIFGQVGSERGLFSFLTTERPAKESSAAPSPVPTDILETPLQATASGMLGPPSRTSSPFPPSDSILRELAKSTSRNVLNGDLFVHAVTRYNQEIVKLKESGDILKNIKNMKGVKNQLWDLIGGQTYQRIVGPRTEELRGYVPFSSNVYGELNPSFLSDIVHLTKLGPESVMIDLGSGVGNCALQIALQTGSESYGCEQLHAAAHIAALQVQEGKRRWAMWGLNAGNIEVWEDDFTTSEEVSKAMRRADVIICNNYAFSPQLNNQLAMLFLDLKEGAQIISLKSFVPPDFKLSARTCGSVQAILQVEEKRFGTAAVSWTDEPGRFYHTVINREHIQKYFQE